MIPLHRNDGFSTKDEAQFFKQLHLKIHRDRQMEAEGEYSRTVQYKAKWKNSRNEISIDRFSYQRFPDPPGEGWPALWTNRPNRFFLLNAGLSGPGLYSSNNTIQSFYRRTTKTVWVVIAYWSKCIVNDAYLHILYCLPDIQTTCTPVIITLGTAFRKSLLQYYFPDIILYFQSLL